MIRGPTIDLACEHRYGHQDHEGKTRVMLYLQFDGASLPRNVGGNRSDRYRVSNGDEGHLSFGPYTAVEAGRYVAGFYIRRIGEPCSGAIDMDVSADGFEILAIRRMKHFELFEDIATFVSLSFVLEQKADRAEVRLFVEKNVLIEVEELVIFSADQRIWGAK
ncbi:hypothetical protein [Sphingomonas immobilis]|uniref:Uncharacterized protein n=1 Tax=Sphingomonas immobilis TaxID=3063997 RepID=A0ABT9A1K3_9SPHN|nr:hypothetical protein [Sphingomonas sp. CA1-15]MDO7843699.1 hypothetical protein [Sphingomonas sp. CA1-15]